MRIPSATYRVQFNREFTFDHASNLVGYLRRLGITDCYASPIFRAGPESTHGYDVCGFDAVNPALGGEDGLRKLSHRLREAKMGLLVDMVPNHMGNDLSNAWWVDVLAKGTESRYANWFDIDWTSASPSQAPQVVLPILEARYGTVLEAGKLQIVEDGGRLAIAYYDRKLPLSKETAEQILQKAGADTAQLDSVLRELNGVPGQPRSFDALDRIIRRQHYRLVFWRIGPQEINYRRFFDITELVSMRMECQEVFQATHELLFDLLEQGIVTGIRVDHPDGLWNPKEYLANLQHRGPVYVAAEKILSGNEPLPEDWEVQGTTGYDFLNRVNGVFVNRDGEHELSRIYGDFSGVRADSLQLMVSGCKRLVLERSFERDVNALANRLKSLCLKTRACLDLTFVELLRAVSDLAVCFPVYRIYITENTISPSESDKGAIEQAFSSAMTGRSGDEPALEFTRSLLLLDMPADFDEAARSEAVEFVMKFQQLTGPLMAKGLEDTTFYRFNRLLSLNEVGGEPDHFGVSVSEFHSHNLSRQRHWPHSLLATATHDTKRGEDLRARLNVLSEMPPQWEQALGRWKDQNQGCKGLTSGMEAPDANDEYFIYQTIVGAWHPEQTAPEADFVERIAACVKKSLKEAKRHTSWTDPNEEYEAASVEFVRRILCSSADNRFVRSLCEFLQPIAFHGFINSLSQLMIKMASPGVPDFYQGTEFWDYNLVDPDNRRPVDFQKRERALRDLESEWETRRSELPGSLLANWRDGRVKMFTTWRFLNYRAANQALFDDGEYVPLEVHGKGANHIVAFARANGSQAIIIVAPRLSFTLMNGEAELPLGNCWADTRLSVPEPLRGMYKDLFTDHDVAVEEEVQLAEVLSRFVVSALVRE
jgi:(1->4)-alpha-D-glucan 1-alpha-D-glucosylmutase